MITESQFVELVIQLTKLKPDSAKDVELVVSAMKAIKITFDQQSAIIHRLCAALESSTEIMAKMHENQVRAVPLIANNRQIIESVKRLA